MCWVVGCFLVSAVWWLLLLVPVLLAQVMLRPTSRTSGITRSHRFGESVRSVGLGMLRGSPKFLRFAACYADALDLTWFFHGQRPAVKWVTLWTWPSIFKLLAAIDVSTWSQNFAFRTWLDQEGCQHSWRVCLTPIKQTALPMEATKCLAKAKPSRDQANCWDIQTSLPSTATACFGRQLKDRSFPPERSGGWPRTQAAGCVVSYAWAFLHAMGLQNALKMLAGL